MSDYRKMWEGLGLDLETHDAVLDIVGKTYQDVFLSQKKSSKRDGVLRFRSVRNSWT